MTVQVLAPTDSRNDNRLYFVERSGRIVRRHWNELSGIEKAHQIEAERRAEYIALFNIY